MTEHADPQDVIRTAARIKQAQLLSSVGAVALGAGLTLQFGGSLAAHAEAIIAVGRNVHGAGTFLQHRAERAVGRARIRWIEALYWVCWILLALLGLVIVVRLFR